MKFFAISFNKNLKGGEKMKKIISGQIKDGGRASTFGCCSNTRILKKS